MPMKDEVSKLKVQIQSFEKDAIQKVAEYQRGFKALQMEMQGYENSFTKLSKELNDELTKISNTIGGLNDNILEVKDIMTVTLESVTLTGLTDDRDTIMKLCSMNSDLIAGFESYLSSHREKIKSKGIEDISILENKTGELEKRREDLLDGFNKHKKESSKMLEEMKASLQLLVDKKL